ncbi:MAG TPA: ATP-binding protein [Candidatus Binataceae bacterium]|nr:ATP-binding protein [Candidatus Binataceae bacterium]
MLGLIFIGLIVFAVLKIRKHRWVDWKGERWRRRTTQAEAFAQDLRTRINNDFESKWARKFEAKAERIERRMRRRFDHQTRRYGGAPVNPVDEHPRPTFKNDAERQAYDRARKRASAEAGFYVHLMWYGVVIGFLFLINLLTTSYPWFLWPAMGWGFGLASHFTAVYGWRWVHQRVFEPAIQREVHREVLQEKEQLRTEKQASLDELTATFAHEIRNPIAAAKSLVQQMGEDPTSHENVEYAKVALDELARVERSVSHLLKYAKEEDYKFSNVNLAGVLDGALTQLRAKLEAKQVVVSRAYLGGPTVRADADKLRQVFSNIIDNAIDAMESTQTGRRLDLAIQNTGNGTATVILRDNGCGIAADKLGKIFNPFYTSKSTGTGLGLGVAKKVIDAHRGTIEVTSTVGTGTEFKISVPLADAVREESPAEEAHESEAFEPVLTTENHNGVPIPMAAASTTDALRARN